jgi:hypothetical protein
MRRILFYFFLISPFISFSQNLKGIVVDSVNNPISFANVQLIEKSTFKSAFFSKTDEKGFFLIECKNIIFPIILKITHLSYKKEEIEINNCNFIKINLKEKTTNLKEVVIEKNVFDVVEKNDTLKYNLAKLLNGSEIKLKDIIEKLPGLSIDNNGKIRFNGKKIDHLLLDGDEFFNDQHQLATENLTPEMIEKIEVLKNYQDTSSIKGFENSSSTALNIGLNEKFKNIFRGNFDIEIGYKEKYKLNANTYNFGKKLKYNLIVNTNNINNNILTINDFLDIKNKLDQNFVKERLGNSEIIQDEDLPKFLFSKDLIRTKTVQNATFNLSNKKGNKKIDFFSVLNKINQKEFTNSNQLFYESPSILKKANTNGSSVYSANILKYENKLNEKKYFFINSYLILNEDIQNSNVNNRISELGENIYFENNLTNNHYKFGFNSKYKNKISDRILFEASLINSYVFSNNQLNILSDDSLIQFDTNSNFLAQKTKYNSFTFGAKGNTTIKLNKKNSFNIGLKSIIYNEKLINEITSQNTLKLETNFQTTENTLFLRFNKKVSGFFRYSTGLDFIDKKVSLSNTKMYFILPNISLMATIQKNLNFAISYNSTKSDYSIYQITNGKIIRDYRTLIMSNNLPIEKLVVNNFQFNTTYSKPSSNLFSLLNISYNSLPKSINKIFENNSIITQEKNSFSNLDKSTYVFFISEKKFNKIPLGINIESLITKLKKATIINNIQTINVNNQNVITFEAKSYFKRNNINFAAGIEYLSSKNVNETNGTTNKYKQYSPYYKFFGQIFNDNLHWESKLTLHKFDMSNLKVNNIYDFGFLLKYDVKDYSLFLSGNNIFNISDNNTKNSVNYNQLFSEETIVSSFSGFINLGFSYSF